MSAERPDPRARLDAWRTSGADRVDPVRFRMLDALERRTAARDGSTRRVLDERLAALLDAYAARVERVDSPRGADAGPPGAANAPAAPATLCALNERLAQHAPPHRAAWPELGLLDEFRQTWSRVSIDRQWRQSRDQVPMNAGPLNSSSLVHRALSLMREQSPGYLQHFLSYVDALSWLKQLGADDAPKDARRATPAAKKGARGRAR